MSSLSSLKKWFALFLCLVATPVDAASSPKVVVTIAPLHSLTSAIMKNTGEPHLLVRGNQSPHHYALTPKDRQILEDADMVFAANRTSLEAFLPKSVTVKELLPGEGDPHQWLSPKMAAYMAEVIARTLTVANPDHTTTYQANLLALQEKLAALQEEIDAALPAGIRQARYATQHPAFGAFEETFKIKGAQNLTHAAESTASMKGLAEIIQSHEQEPLRCLIHEPQMPAGIFTRLSEQTGVELVIVDPLGATLPPGAEQYFDLMRAISTRLAPCIEGTIP